MEIDGQKIVKFRAEHNLTQVELAEKIKVAPLTIIRAENKNRCSKTTKALIEELIRKETE